MEDQALWRLVKNGVIERPVCMPGMIDQYAKDLEAYCDYADTKYEELLANYANLERRVTEIENDLSKLKASPL